MKKRNVITVCCLIVVLIFVVFIIGFSPNVKAITPASEKLFGLRVMEGRITDNGDFIIWTHNGVSKVLKLNGIVDYINYKHEPNSHYAVLVNDSYVEGINAKDRITTVGGNQFKSITEFKTLLQEYKEGRDLFGLVKDGERNNLVAVFPSQSKIKLASIKDCEPWMCCGSIMNKYCDDGTGGSGQCKEVRDAFQRCGWETTPTVHCCTIYET